MVRSGEVMSDVQVSLSKLRAGDGEIISCELQV